MAAQCSATRTLFMVAAVGGPLGAEVLQQPTEFYLATTSRSEVGDDMVPLENFGPNQQP